ncbi:hypothetical protein [Gemmatimonas sp.]|uniref:hypothetical protein n=1 Tax=Gemmatimonas sp. TaxID=1962908 RepID=UPI00333ED5CA
MLLFCNVNHRSPLGVNVMVCGVFRGGLGHGVARDLARLAIDTTNHTVAVAGIPRVARGVDVDGVRIGPGVDFEALELLGGGVEARDVIPLLPDEPDAPLRIDGRIAWTGRGAPGDIPLGECDGIGGGFARRR